MSSDDHNMHECRENFLRLVLKDPPLMKSKSSQSYFESYIKNKNKLDFYLTNREKLIFLIGPSGCGKSHFIENYKKSQNKEYYFKTKNFIGISRLNEAYLHLSGYLKSLIIIFSLIFFIFIVSNIIEYYDFEFISLSILLFYIFAVNKFNITYACSEYISFFSKRMALKGLPIMSLAYQILEKRNISYLNKHKVMIIEDLDCSSLKENDKWALLSNLWNLKTTYIVLLNYMNLDCSLDSMRFHLLQKCEKLEGKMIEFNPSWQLNEMIMIEYLRSLFLLNDEFKTPFYRPAWLEYFTPRELICTIDKFKYDFAQYKFKKYGETGDVFFNCILIRTFLLAYMDKQCLLNIDDTLKIYFVGKEDSATPQIIKIFYQSIETFLSNDVFNREQEETSLAIRKQIFLESEEQLLKFFDENLNNWNKNDENASEKTDR
ncbi:hypothetical protein [Fluviispira sanaruensis]|uniref:Uncharacterized protein n=1 Tax=Fluviispira sanaruensis TaxID=2493639 RepID=A0A4P2VKA9_FLUSA|nr:hypothetical protein [Fluviispira sanaruensis]BBH53723.1 hypothetical protein JCM31447_21700 [Fluviispira sanaruensis]